MTQLHNDKRKVFKLQTRCILYSSPQYDFFGGNAGLPFFSHGSVKKKALVFVDANNWYHNVKKYLGPSQVDIERVAELICNIRSYKLQGVRWYASIPSIADGKSAYYKHMSFLQHLEKKGIKIITRKLQRFSNKEIEQRKRKILDHLHLCKACKPLVTSEFLALTDVKKKEKGIDVWIAIDMVKYALIEHTCDVCILISGDTDFIPALALITSEGKEILTAMTPSGYSSELRNRFPFFILKKETLMSCLRNKDREEAR